MTLTMVFLFVVFITTSTGYYYGFKERKALTPQTPEINLYKTLESAQKTIEDSWKQLNPAHEPDCACAYCEIQYGDRLLRPGRTDKLRNPFDEYAPVYVHQLQKKMVGLQTEVKDLRAELEHRDRNEALRYQAMEHADKSQSPVVLTEDRDGRSVKTFISPADRIIQ